VNETGEGRTHNILMRIQEDVEAIISCLPQDLNCMLNPFFVVFAWPGRLDCLPGKYVSDCIVAPLFQPVEVDMSIFSRERASMKINIISIKKIVGYMRWKIRRAGILCVPCEIDSSERYLTAMGIAELAIFNSKPQGHVVLVRIQELDGFGKRTSGSSLRGVAQSDTWGHRIREYLAAQITQ
jgi:hypothetical protein